MKNSNAGEIIAIGFVCAVFFAGIALINYTGEQANFEFNTVRAVLQGSVCEFDMNKLDSSHPLTGVQISGNVQLDNVRCKSFGWYKP